MIEQRNNLKIFGIKHLYHILLQLYFTHMRTGLCFSTNLQQSWLSGYIMTADRL